MKFVWFMLIVISALLGMILLDLEAIIEYLPKMAALSVL